MQELFSGKVQGLLRWLFPTCSSGFQVGIPGRKTRGDIRPVQHSHPSRAKRTAPPEPAPWPCLSAVSVPALAETNVAIYGIIDAGLLYQGGRTRTAKRASMETSGLRQSVLGFKGDRDLGRGLENFFNLEVHYDTNSGKLHGTGDARVPVRPSSVVRRTWGCVATGAL